MKTLTHILASFFRKANARLLYPEPWPVRKFTKIIFFVSVKVYKSWMKNSHASAVVPITVDRDIHLHVDVSKAMGAAFYWMGYHELREWRFLNQYLRPDMSFMDIGANQGEFTLFAAKRLVHGKVYAFEPVDMFYRQLKGNIALNGYTNIETFHFGLSDARGTLPIYLGKAGIGEHEGLATVFQTDERNRFVQDIQLRVLDEEMAQTDIKRLDVIKIDVEGGEWMVLKGGRETIKKFRPLVMMEISESNFRAAGYTFGDILMFFTELDYSMHEVNRQNRLNKIETVRGFCNVVFVPGRNGSI